MRVTARGTWPGRLVLRQGWAKGQARPWNADVPDAHLRLIRGGKSFLASSGQFLLAQGAPGVMSPPLPDSSSGIWLSAGYEPYLYLDLYSRDLVGTLPKPTHDIPTGASNDWEGPEIIDRAAFPDLWRLDRDGLHEALHATPHAEVLLTHHAGQLTGFAIVGVGSIAGYLQRVAVHPDHRGHGFGRSLVRAAMAWAKRRGARSILLNTQPDNAAAAQLYESEGFDKLLDQLTILRLVTP